VAEAIEGTFTAKVWRHPGEASWHFLTLKDGLADEIRSQVEPAGFGSVRVEATLGGTTWLTSVFPDKASGSYVLPVKAAVRRKERIEADDEVTIRLLISR
jgi:hypothetical protein